MKKDTYAYVAVFSQEEDGISIEFPVATPITQLVLEPNQVPFLAEVFMPPVRENQ